MKRLIFYLLIILLLSSCTNTYQNYLNNYSSLFNNYSSLFPKEMINHFPKEVDSLYTINYVCADTSNDNELFKINRLALSTYTKKLQLERIEEKLKKEAIQIISADDSCALIVQALNTESPNLEDEFYKIINTYDNKEVLKEYIDSSNYELTKLLNSCNTITLPIPNFSSFRCNEKILSNGNRLNKDFTLYILEAKQGKFLESKYLSKAYGLPPEWKNGFSKGIAINNKADIIVYWILIW